jgi:DNA polymerase III subunit gamma/tau
VYILDEAHMLSTAAWNAFLKTLEEPPPNTVFVLATTEAQKVPATVVDRCHRFDFHRPSVEQIASVLRRTAEAESIDVPPAALAALARSATGSFRDALGTLEQLVTYSGNEIALADALAVLGVADGRLLEETVDAVAEGDARRALKALEECVEQGRDAASFASDLEVRARELLVVQTLGEVPAELSLTAEADAALQAQAERVAQDTIVRLLELLGEAMEGVRAGADPRTRLELSLVKAARPDFDASARALQARIARLEAEHGTVSATAAHRAALDPDAQAAAADPSPRPPAEGPALAAAPAADTAGDAPPSPASGTVGDLESLRSLWPAVVALVRGENALLGALIEEAQPVDAADGQLTVAFAASAPFLKKKAEDPANRAAVTAALGNVTGGRWRLSYELRGELDAREREQPAASSEEEWVRRFMEEFDAEELPPTGAVPVGENGAERAGDEEKGA